MPRYIVERTFPAGLQIPAGQEGAQACLAVVNRNAVDSVTWVHSCQGRLKEHPFSPVENAPPLWAGEGW